MSFVIFFAMCYEVKQFKEGEMVETCGTLRVVEKGEQRFRKNKLIVS
jgi:hypothetical protein